MPLAMEIKNETNHNDYNNAVLSVDPYELRINGIE